MASALAASTTASQSARQPAESFIAAPRTETVLSAVLQLRLATPADATVGSATILGGDVHGELAGTVQPGSLEWTRDPVRGVLQLAARFEIQAGAGLRVHVADRATVVAPTQCWAAPFATTPELTVVDGPPDACREAVYLGRMDASRLQAGRLHLTVHRVL
jgi:hypothetical protein